MSNYSAIIQRLTLNIPSSLVDFNTPRDKGRIPTQASSNFITNKEQGDWAEDVLFRAINENSNNIIAVRYGKSDNIIAGDDGFSEFYESYQQELDKIGKRPDILLFRKEDFNESLGNDISQIPHADILEYVKKAIAGIEVRSSAFLIDKYDEIMRILTELRNYTEMHFHDEESYMEQIHYADLDAQRRAHNAFIEKLVDINFEELESLDNNQQEYLQDVLDFLAKWLVNHILKMDKLIR